MGTRVTLDPRRLRAMLAEEQVTRTEFARRCGLSRLYVGRILAGRVQPGELAAIKVQRGLLTLGMPAGPADERQAGDD
jgi:transcriptional regulator with XRE-family HTH domain